MPTQQKTPRKARETEAQRTAKPTVSTAKGVYAHVLGVRPPPRGTRKATSRRRTMALIHRRVAQIFLPRRAVWATLGDVSRGHPYEVCVALAAKLGLSENEVGALASIEPKTLARRRAEGKFRPLESERFARLARVFALTAEFFDGDENAARVWLLRERDVLRGLKPIEAASTEAGAREVERILTRLDHGIPL